MQIHMGGLEYVQNIHSENHFQLKRYIQHHSAMVTIRRVLEKCSKGNIILF